MGFQISKDEVNDEFELPKANTWHRFRVVECTSSRSKKGDAMYNLKLETEHGNVWDVAMLQGPGNGIGLRKLQTLGAVVDLGDTWDVIDARSVEGLRGWCRVKHEEYNGKTNAKVDINQGEAGFMPIDWTPPGYGEGGGRQDVGDGPDDEEEPPF